MPKMHQNTFGGRAQSGPDGGFFCAPTDPLATMEDLVLRGEGKGRRGMDRERKGIPPPKSR